METRDSDAESHVPERAEPSPSERNTSDQLRVSPPDVDQLPPGVHPLSSSNPISDERTERIFQTQDLLSALSIESSNVAVPEALLARLNSLQRPIMQPVPDQPEADRQRFVEMSLASKIAAMRRTDMEFGAAHGMKYITYGGEHHLQDIMNLITKDLSEPYSIYTYRYFIYQWPKLCHLAVDENGIIVGTIVCKMENTKGPLGRNDNIRRGYIAMLAVDKSQRRKKIGTTLVVSAVESLANNGCDEVVLETETTNQAALKLYENLGFARHKRLLKYYLNGVDAFRLKLWIRYPGVVRDRARGNFNDPVQNIVGDNISQRNTHRSGS